MCLNNCPYGLSHKRGGQNCSHLSPQCCGELLFRICTYRFSYSSGTELCHLCEIIPCLVSLETLSINRRCRPFVSWEFLDIWQIIQVATAHVQIDSNVDVQWDGFILCILNLTAQALEVWYLPDVFSLCICAVELVCWCTVNLTHLECILQTVCSYTPIGLPKSYTGCVPWAQKALAFCRWGQLPLCPVAIKTHNS